MQSCIGNTLAFETNYKTDLANLDYDKAAELNAIDIWICLHFRKLPTEKVVQDLSDEAKILLFKGFLNAPSREELQLLYAKQLQNEKEQFANESLRKMGYSDAQIKEIREELRTRPVEIDPYLVGG